MLWLSTSYNSKWISNDNSPSLHYRKPLPRSRNPTYLHRGVRVCLSETSHFKMINYGTKHGQVAPSQLFVRGTQILLELLKRELYRRSIKKVLQRLHKLTILEKHGRHISLWDDGFVVIGEEMLPHELVQHQMVHLEVGEILLLRIDKPQDDGEEVLQFHHRPDLLRDEDLLHQDLHQLLPLTHLEGVGIPIMLNEVVEGHPILLWTILCHDSLTYFRELSFTILTILWKMTFLSYSKPISSLYSEGMWW